MNRFDRETFNKPAVATDKIFYKPVNYYQRVL